MYKKRFFFCWFCFLSKHLRQHCDYGENQKKKKRSFFRLIFPCPHNANYHIRSISLFKGKRESQSHVHLIGDSSISKKSLFIGTLESRRTRAQKRRRELSTCRMHGMQSNKECICCVAPLPCLRTYINEYRVGFYLVERGKKKTKKNNSSCREINTVKQRSNQITPTKQSPATFWREPGSRRAHHNWPIPAPLEGSTLRG